MGTNSAHETAYAHCRDLVRRHDKDRFLASLFAPKDRRDHLFALYAFNIEVARVREAVSDALPGEVRLQWWSEALAGCGHGEVGRHPVAAALIDTLECHALPADPLLDLIETRVSDLYDEPVHSVAELKGYAAHTSSIPMQLAAKILDAQEGDATDSMALHGGIAYALVGLLRALPFHASRGKVYIPEEVLARHGAVAHDILAGRSSPELLAALAEMREIVRSQMVEAGGSANGCSPLRSVPAFLPLALVQPYLKRMERENYEPFADCTIPQWRRQWFMWRAARCAKPS